MWWQQLWPEPLVLLAVVLTSQLLVLPSSYHPLTLFRYFARQLGRKVHPDPARPRQQLHLSGSLAVIVAVSPPVLLCYSLYLFSELPLALDALLLYICLDWPLQRKQLLNVSDNLRRNQLGLAREQAASILLRDSSRLTEMGLSKALIETVILRSCKLELAVWFWFLLGGGVAALLYRLIHELAQQWNCKLPENKHFAAAASWLSELSAALPLAIATAILALQYGIRRCMRQSRVTRQFFSRSSFYLLSCASVATRCSLGGPAYYAGQKALRSRFTQQRQPGWRDVSISIRIVHFIQLYFMLFVMSLLLLQLALVFLQ